MFGPLANLIFAAALAVLGGFALRGRVRRADRPVAAAFLLALALAGFFGFRLVDRALFWMAPSHQRMTPAPWMTLGFIERSWRLPPRSLRDVVLAPDEAGPRGRTLERIAKDRGVPVAQVIAEVTAAVQRAAPAAAPGP